MIQFGYACLNMELRDKSIFNSRTMRKKTFEEKGLAYTSKLCLQNCRDLVTILRWNNKHNIKLFRISSEMFPWASEYQLEDLPDFEEISKVLEIAGKYADITGQRLSFHPGQFNCLASEKNHVVENCIKDLEIHSKIFDLMHRPASHYAKINIHLGSTCGGDLQKAAYNFCKNYDKLSDNLKSRLTVENDDKEAMFSTKFLYENISNIINVPIVFDAHHFELGPQDSSYEESFMMAYESWNGVRPTFHYSNSKKTYEDPDCRVYTAHSDYYYKPFNAVVSDVDVMLEAKCKEKALFKYLQDFKQ